MPAQLQIQVDHDRIVAFCKQYHILKLAFFGSVLRDDFTDESDVDVLVEFDPKHMPGLFAVAGMEIELSEMLGRKADLRTKEDISKYFRDEVVTSAFVQYVA